MGDILRFFIADQELFWLRTEERKGEMSGKACNAAWKVAV